MAFTDEQLAKAFANDPSKLQNWIDSSPLNAAKFENGMYAQNPALSTGSPRGNPGYSFAGATYAPQHYDAATGQVTGGQKQTQDGEVVWVGDEGGDTQMNRDIFSQWLSDTSVVNPNNISYRGLLDAPVSNATAQPAATTQAAANVAPVAPEAPTGPTPQQEKLFAKTLLDKARAGELTPEQSLQLFQSAPSWEGYGRTGRAEIAKNFYNSVQSNPDMYDSLSPQEQMQYQWLRYQQGEISGNNAQDQIKKIRKANNLPQDVYEGENRLITRYKATKEGRADGIDPSDVYDIGGYTQSDTGNDGGAFGSALNNITSPFLPGFNLKDVANVLEPVTSLLDTPVIKYGLMAAGAAGFISAIASNGLPAALAMAANGELGAEGLAGLEYLSKIPTANEALMAFQEQVNPRPDMKRGNPAEIGDLNDPNNDIEPDDALGAITQLPGLPPSEDNGATPNSGSSQASNPDEIGQGSGNDSMQNVVEFQIWEAVNNASDPALKERLIEEYENYTGQQYDPNNPPQANQTDSTGGTTDDTGTQGEDDGMLGGLLGGLWGLGGVGGTGGSGGTGGTGDTGTGAEDTGTEDNTGDSTEGNDMGYLIALLTGLWGLNGTGVFGNDGGNGNGGNTDNNNDPVVPPVGGGTGGGSGNVPGQDMTTRYTPTEYGSRPQRPLFDINEGKLLAPMVKPAENAGQDTWEEWLRKYYARGGSDAGLLNMIAGPTSTKGSGII